MRSGDLRERVTIQRKQEWLGQWGHESGWVDVATVWASVLPTKGAERVSDKGVDSSTSYTIRLRHRPDLTSKCRVIWRGFIVDLVSVTDPNGRRQELILEGVLHGDGEVAA